LTNVRPLLLNGRTCEWLGEQLEGLKCGNFVAWYRSMGNLLFWLGLGAAQKSAGSKEINPSRHRVISFVVGILLALLIVAGLFILLVSQQ
jgi:hypothetical protein